jgi:uncharacterized protein YjbJ (UPF0337 family)
MNKDQWAGICKQISGHLKEGWGTLTGDPALLTSGALDRVAGRNQERHGVAQQARARELIDFFKRNRDWLQSSRRSRGLRGIPARAMAHQAPQNPAQRPGFHRAAGGRSPFSPLRSIRMNAFPGPRDRAL